MAQLDAKCACAACAADTSSRVIMDDAAQWGTRRKCPQQREQLLRRVEAARYSFPLPTAAAVAGRYKSCAARPGLIALWRESRGHCCAFLWTLDSARLEQK